MTAVPLLLLLALLAGTTASPLAVSPAALTQPTATLGQAFRVRNNTRCNGHYRVASWTNKAVAECTAHCQSDEACASFSLEQSNGRDCFLFDSEAACVGQQGWTTGHKDTRCTSTPEGGIAKLECPFGTVISTVEFASYGTPRGACNAFQRGDCHADESEQLLRSLCVGERECSVSVTSSLFGEPCGGKARSLSAQITCAASKAFNEDVYFNAWSSRHWPAARGQIEQRRTEWRAYLAALAPYPAGRFSGRGIIVVAGGKYLRPAIVMIKMLRQAGCSLRIQVWHVGSHEMTAAHKVLLKPYHVETRDFEDFVSGQALEPIAANVGLRLFQLKPLALLHTDLEDVLLLDSDNCPTRDPSYLFEDARFRAAGTVFWPDYWKTSADNPIWSIIDHAPIDMWEQESGQLMISKRVAWRAINLCVHLNTAFYMKLLNGDKDTFRFSWIASQTPYHMIQSWPVAVGTLKESHSDQQGFCSHTMLQHDFDGQPIFVHHNQLKTAQLPVGENFRYQKTPGSLPDYKAVPVSGLRLKHGVIPCIDVQGVWLSQVDEDRCIVSESRLARFEADYFRAQAEVPTVLFQHSQQTLLGNSDLKLNRGRRNTTGCPPSQFEVEDSLCDLITTCNVGESETSAAAAAADTRCESVTLAVQEYEVREVPKAAGHPLFGVGSPNTYEVRDVTGAGVFTAAPTIQLTRTGFYRFSMVDVTAPFYISTSSVGQGAGVVSDGVSPSDGLVPADGVTTAQSVDFEPAETAPNFLFYQAISAASVGGRLHMFNPAFTKRFVARDGAVGQRFSTAHNPDAIIQQLAGAVNAVTRQDFRDLRGVCQPRCVSTPGCRGYFIYEAVNRHRCNLLSDIGTASAATILDSQSWSKDVL